MSRITLTEHRPVLLELSQADQQQLDRLRFDLRPDFHGGGVWVNAGSTAGVLLLPSGTVLEIRPKVPLRNLLWMLSSVHHLNVRYLDETVPLERFEDLLECIARFFTELVEQQLDMGLYRNYVEFEGNTASVRGRIVIAEDLRQNLILRQRTWCRYAEFTWDLPENQVIRQVIQQLAGWGFGGGLTSRLIALDMQLAEITPSYFTSQDIDRFVYNRQSRTYESIHRICRLFLDDESLGEQAGSVHFNGFLVNMDSLFESFVSQEVRRRLRLPHVLHLQYQTALDERGSLSIRPDLVVTYAGMPVYIADCKYKKLDTGSHLHGDIYQMLAYATVLGLDEGLLVYPRHENVIEGELRVKHSPVTIRETTLDLSQSVSLIERALDNLAERMTGLKGTEATSHPCADQQ